MPHKPLIRTLFLLPLLWLGACSTVPQAIRSAPPEAPSLPALREQPASYQGQTLRLGGVIAQLHNRAEDTQIEVVARRLSRGGEPRQEDFSEGRFIATVPGFLDPAIYAQGRRITVSGEFIGTIERPLGELPYRYPQLQASAYYLWPEWREQPDPRYQHPWYPYGYPYGYPYRPGYDPFWSPFWYPYPW
ncbi:MAG: Slp family lipoprotein [Chromatiales bacterium]|nr:Slp family lipoprotein [Gammaproteobacteria bacterium]MBW6476490.1 Slp family lipoprotein [Chromatiales bacterium]